MTNRISSFIFGFFAAILLLVVALYLRERFVTQNVIIFNSTSAPIFLVTIGDSMATTTFSGGSFPRIDASRTAKFSPLMSAGSKDVTVQVRFGTRDASNSQQSVSCFSSGFGTLNIEVSSEEIACK